MNDPTVRSELVEGVIEGVTAVVDTVPPVETDLAAAASRSSPDVVDENSGRLLITGEGEVV